MIHSSNDAIAITQDEITTDTVKEIWKTYGYWAFLVGIAFFSIYPTCNWLTSEREQTYNLFFTAELSVPFVPLFYWFYISLYALFLLPPFFMDVQSLKLLGKRIVVATLISGVIFVLFPTSLGFERVTPNGFYAELFSTIFTLDLPHNMVPSLHVVYSAFILIAVAQSVKGYLFKGVFLLWLGLVCLSTLLVHQHHIIDIVSAFILVWIVSKILIKGKKDV